LRYDYSSRGEFLIQDKKRWLSAWARLEAFRQNLPTYITAERVEQYHSLISDLQVASGEFLNEFRIPEDKVKPKLLPIRGRAGTSLSMQYSKDKYCDSDYFVGQVNALWQYLKHVTEPSVSAPEQAAIPHHLELTGTSDAHHELRTSQSNKISVFISHSSHDKKIADALTELLKNALEIDPQSIRCTSVEGHRLPVGARTGDQLKQELLESKSFVALLTKHSISSTWVLFELGARWAVGHHLAPLLAGGLTAAELGGPLPDINALSCESDADLHQFVQDTADVLGVKARRPEVYTRYITILKELSQKQKEGQDRGAL